jgi:hypothetical protein
MTRSLNNKHLNLNLDVLIIFQNIESIVFNFLKELDNYINTVMYIFCLPFYIYFFIVMRRKTIYEYHRIGLNEDDVTNGTVIILTALPTCLEKKNCTSCMKKDINFEVIYKKI